ncbi:hypothetical protein [Lutimonas halocynthiae]|uniref:hypothetical protein n=1 Tax=Lutimonas halocynthiae TaxID=1446477 RepID=UPI0025B52E94|nr:hypothetical protein [Lutimonas halocynthiae]
MDDIFLALVDSLHTEIRVGFRPPPPLSNGIVMNDSIKKSHSQILKKTLLEYRRNLDSVRNDTSKLNIAIHDTVYDARKRNLLNYLKSKKYKEYEWDTENGSAIYRIDLSDFQENKLFRFKYGSELPLDQNQWHKLGIYELIGFSTIVFDTAKTYGAMNAWSYCGRLCGSGFLVFLKKEKGKWLIDKVELTSVS